MKEDQGLSLAMFDVEACCGGEIRIMIGASQASIGLGLMFLEKIQIDYLL